MINRCENYLESVWCIFWTSYFIAEYIHLCHMPMHHTLVYIIVWSLGLPVHWAIGAKRNKPIVSWSLEWVSKLLILNRLMQILLHVQCLLIWTSLFPRLFANGFSIGVTINYKSTNGNAFTGIELFLSIAHLHEYYCKFENK